MEPQLLAARFELAWWAEPREGLSLEGLADLVGGTGGMVLEVDRPRNRLLIGYESDNR